MQGMSRNCVGLRHTKIKFSIPFNENEGELIILVLQIFRAINICIRLCLLPVNFASEHVCYCYSDICLVIIDFVSEYYF